MYTKVIKRSLDLIFSGLLIIPSIPIMGLIALLIKSEDPNGGILFRQKRVGFKNEPFTVMKFRSMTTIREKNGKELLDRERMLKIGGVIRKLSLDELPQLFNVIKGEMSFIGPRPLPIIYFPFFTDKELHRHDVRPGISGLAQVNGRNNISWDKKFEYDLDYVSNISIFMDVKILILTILKVLKRSDVKVRAAHEKDGSLDEIRQPLRNPMR